MDATTDHTHETALEVKICHAESAANNAGGGAEGERVFYNFIGARDYQTLLDAMV
jgi:hypothetical protein